MNDLTGLSTTISVTSLSGHDNIWGVCTCITENSGNTYTLTSSLEFSINYILMNILNL